MDIFKYGQDISGLVISPQRQLHILNVDWNTGTLENERKGIAAVKLQSELLYKLFKSIKITLSHKV
jgi:hypothetical protein